jgi:hypothetical protein
MEMLARSASECMLQLPRSAIPLCELGNTPPRVLTLKS